VRLATSTYSLGAGKRGVVALHLDSRALGLLAKAKSRGLSVTEAALVTGGTTVREQIRLLS
jgi:hypothetical protein